MKTTILHRLYVLILVIASVFVSCKKDETEPVQETGTVMDIDNNVYKTVKIGNQWWMAENLRVKTFRNGTPIQKVQSMNNWINTQSAYCIYQENEESPGLLYNWNAVADANNIAPSGWHVPTDEEWKELEKHLGMNQSDADNLNWRGTDQGDKLKALGNSEWSVYAGVWGNNESGFNALAGSCRLFNGKWGEPGLLSNGYWWTSTEKSRDEIWYRNLDYKDKRVFRSIAPREYGFSIRCVKDR